MIPHYNNIMKNIYLITGIILITHLFGCKKPNEKTKVIYYEFLLHNQSDNSVTLNLYKRDNSLYNSTFIDSNQTQLIDSGNKYFSLGGPDFYLTVNLDSAEFIFKDNKKLVMQPYPVNGVLDTINNVTLIGYYKLIKETYDKRTFLFTLTQSDYLRAK